MLCKQYVKTHSITFNPNRSKLLCYKVDETVDIFPIFLNGVNHFTLLAQINI